MQEVLLSSGFRAGTLEAVSSHWRIIDILHAQDAITWLKAAKRLPAAVVVGNVRRPEDDGQLHWENRPHNGIVAAHEALEEIRKIDPELPVIISTSLDMPAAIVELVKRGAFDYVVEPVVPLKPQDEQRYTRELVFALKRAVLWRETVLENRRLKEELKGPESDIPIVGKSRAITQVIGLIRKVAPTLATVLVTGESGTGKELVARAIHLLSSRGKGPFVAINCGTFSDALISSELFGHVKGAFTGADGNKKGLIQEAQAGTLFLDEIAGVSPAFQVSLLRVLENRAARPVGGQVEYPVNCRFVAAANRNLLELSEAGGFREDLYYRLNLFHIHLPALRERAEDIPSLAQAFLTRAAREYGRTISGFDAGAMGMLERFQWPGNVRQLRNAVERAVILCETGRITPGDLPDYLRGDGTGETQASAAAEAREQGRFEDVMARYERGLLESALKEADGNRSEAARILGVKRTTLYSRMKALGIAGEK
jgi:DNA-binding NtrC family response regulator